MTALLNRLYCSSFFQALSVPHLPSRLLTRIAVIPLSKAVTMMVSKSGVDFGPCP